MLYKLFLADLLPLIDTACGFFMNTGFSQFIVVTNIR